MFELNQSHATGQTARPFKRDDGKQEIFAVSKFESSDYLQRKKKDIAPVPNATQKPNTRRRANHPTRTHIAPFHLGSFSTGVFGIAFTA